MDFSVSLICCNLTKSNYFFVIFAFAKAVTFARHATLHLNRNYYIVLSWALKAMMSKLRASTKYHSSYSKRQIESNDQLINHVKWVANPFNNGVVCHKCFFKSFQLTVHGVRTIPPRIFSAASSTFSHVTITGESGSQNGSKRIFSSWSNVPFSLNKNDLSLNPILTTFSAACMQGPNKCQRTWFSFFF